MNQDNMKSEKLQDAIGLVKDEFIEEAVSSGPEEKVYYNSWVKLAQNDERKKKMSKSRLNSRTTQSITVAVACLLLFVSVGIPWAKNHFNLGKDSSGESAVTSIEAENKVEEAEESEEAVTAEAVADGETADGETEAAYDVSDIPSQVPTEMEGEAFVLTGGEWNDNLNWPFFTNLVTSDIVSFPSYGLDPRNRIRVTVTDDSGSVLKGEEVVLRDQYDKVVWTAKTNKDGVCYLFYGDGINPAYIMVNDIAEELQVAETSGEDFQSSTQVAINEDVTITVPKRAADAVGTQIMFIVDTTGSMGDELAYLQKDFASIAEETFDGNTWFATAFYRDHGDEYVTKVNEFTQNLAMVQNQFGGEYANGGGDTPEAVADILAESISNNGQWRDDCNKVAFLIFDAPPHEGDEAIISGAVQTAAARGIHLVPVVASNAERDTELFGRTLAILTDGTYVFLTDDSGVGESHLEPIVGDYTVELLHDIIVRVINGYK